MRIACHGARQSHQFLEGEFRRLVCLPAIRTLRQNLPGTVDDNFIEAFVPEEVGDRGEEFADDANIGGFGHGQSYFATSVERGLKSPRTALS